MSPHQGKMDTKTGPGLFSLNALRRKMRSGPKMLPKSLIKFLKFTNFK